MKLVPISSGVVNLKCSKEIVLLHFSIGNISHFITIALIHQPTFSVVECFWDVLVDQNILVHCSMQEKKSPSRYCFTFVQYSKGYISYIYFQSFPLLEIINGYTFVLSLSISEIVPYFPIKIGFNALIPIVSIQVYMVIILI